MSEICHGSQNVVKVFNVLYLTRIGYANPPTSPPSNYFVRCLVKRWYYLQLFLSSRKLYSLNKAIMLCWRLKVALLQYLLAISVSGSSYIKKKNRTKCSNKAKFK